MDIEIEKFLTALVAHGGALSNRSMHIPICTREQDKARQAARRKGWVEYVKGTGWVISNTGRDALRARKGEAA